MALEYSVHGLFFVFTTWYDGGNQDNDDEGDRGGTSTSGCASATGDLHHMSGLIIAFWLSIGFIITRLRDREYL